MFQSACKRTTAVNYKTLRKNLVNLLKNPHNFTKNPIQKPISIPMSHSRSSTILPISHQDEKLKYLNPHGEHVRIGKLLEDLDSMAVHISYKHVDNQISEENTHPMGIVTAFVDQIEIHQPKIPIDENLILNGQVTWVGSSSMEISMSIEDESTKTKYLDALFLMVARNSDNDKAAQVNHLKLESMDDKLNFQMGELNKQNRIKTSKKNLLSTPPSEKEAEVIHDSFLKTLDSENMTFASSARKLQNNQIWMEEAKLKSVLIAMPQHKNVHGKLFGGHIMRKAYELAYSNALLTASKPIFCTAIDDISFIAPVNIGSIFKLSSQVVFCKNNRAVVRVYASVHDPIVDESKTTNTFYFIFQTMDESQMPEVIAKTYGEALLNIDGRRIYDENYEE